MNGRAPFIFRCRFALLCCQLFEFTAGATDGKQRNHHSPKGTGNRYYVLSGENSEHGRLPADILAQKSAPDFVARCVQGFGHSCLADIWRRQAPKVSPANAKSGLGHPHQPAWGSHMRLRAAWFDCLPQVLSIQALPTTTLPS